MAKASFLPAVVDVDLYEGDDADLVLEQWTDDAMTVPRSIAGITFTAQIRKKRVSEDADMVALTVTTHQGLSSSDPTTITISFPRTLRDKGWKTAVWDLQQTLTVGTVPTTLYGGDVTFLKDVTR